MSPWLLVAIAAVSMFVQDVLGTVMVMAEAKHEAHLAATMDTLQWIVTITCTTISVTALSGHNLWEKVAVVAFVSAANYLGTLSGVSIGKRLLRTTVPDPSE